MTNLNHRTCFTHFILFVFVSCLFQLPIISYGGPLTLGSKLTVASGNDPDIAIDKDFSLHLAYVKGSSTYYRKIYQPYQLGKMSQEYLVGSGVNPQIEVDSLGNPHIVFGYARYSRWNGSGFTKAVQAFSGWRKNLIAIDSKDRVYIVADRNSPRDVLVRVYRYGTAITNTASLGSDNPGGIAIDGEDTLHATWRLNSTYYNTYTINSGKGASHMFPHGSGDFSWCSADVQRNTVHAVHTARDAGGIYYIAKRNNKWSESVLFAQEELRGSEPDNVNPVSATDALGKTYITFAGRGSRGYFALMDNTDQLYSGVQRLDPETDSNAGAKMTNPNVVSNSTINGAFVAWGTKNVFVRSIGYSPVSSFVPFLSPTYTILLQKDDPTPLASVMIPIRYLLLKNRDIKK